MTEKQKKIALVIGTVVIAVIILLWSRRASGSTIINKEGMAPINVSIPSLNLPPRTPFAINIPGLPAFTPYQFSAISPCMCNGAATSLPSDSGFSITFVTNEGNSGPNIYNNALIDSRNDGIAGNADSVYASTGSYFYSG
jgi:hypothetical protein